MMIHNHSKLLSPSKWHMWSNCAGSPHAMLHMPDLYSDPAELGKALHSCAEAALRTSLNAENFLGLNFNGYEITEDHIDAVQEYIDRCRTRPGELKGVEDRGGLPDIHVDLFGTCDHWAYDLMTQTLYIDDAKFGHAAVDSNGNGQLMIYALIIIGKLFTLGYLVRNIVIKITQPYAYNIEDNPEYELTVQELNDWKVNRLIPAVNLVVQDNPPRNPGEHCKYCSAKITCPEYLSWCNYNIEPPFPLTNESISNLMKWIPTVENLKKTVELEGTKRLITGEIIPGCKLIETVKHKKFLDPDMVEQHLAPMFSDRIYKTKKLKSPKQIHDSVPTKYREWVNDQTYKPPGDRKIALITDRRKAVATAQEVFKNV